MDRLEANSTWITESGCRVWLGALVRDHGAVKVGGKLMTVHRVAWELERGPIPKGLWVLHSCGVGPCFNVNHLRLGTREENASDRVAHGGYVGRPGGGLLGGVRVSSLAIPRFTAGQDAPISAAEVRRVLSYDPATGEFRWNVRSDRDASWNARFSDEIAGAVLTNGYRYINFNKKLHLAHRIAWLWMTGAQPEVQIDHINGDRADNRWSNLRAATQKQNSANQGLRTNNRSGVKGVSWESRSKKWRADITIGGKQIVLGRFRTIEDAAAARRAAETDHHGAFARSGVN